MKFIEFTKDLNKELAFDIFESHVAVTDEGQAMHRHNFLELNYVVSGNGLYYISDQVYEIDKGDLFIINNSEYHLAVNTSNDLVMKVIIFSPETVWTAGNPLDQKYLKTFFEWKNDFKHHIRHSDMVLVERVKYLFYSIESEWKDKQVGYQLMIKAQLLQMLAVLYRAYESIEANANQVLNFQNRYNRILAAIDYMDHHFNEKVSLETLADQVHMNPNYFSTYFKEVMGTSLVLYLRNKRIDHACMLLKTTKASVTDIAIASGFNNISYFNKSFREQMYKSPRAYRSQ